MLRRAGAAAAVVSARLPPAAAAVAAVLARLPPAAAILSESLALQLVGDSSALAPRLFEVGLDAAMRLSIRGCTMLKRGSLTDTVNLRFRVPGSMTQTCQHGHAVYSTENAG